MIEGDVLRVLMGQMAIVWGDAQANLRRAAEVMAEGGRQNCDLVLLPECLDVGWTHPRAADLAEPVPGPHFEPLAGAARENGVWVVAGLTEHDGMHTFNAGVLISPEGRLVLKHRKVNLLDIARPYYTPGDRLAVAETPFGRLGLTICADNAPDALVLGKSLGMMGARAILSPCAWAVEADDDGPYGQMWRDAYGELAEQFSMPVVGVSGVGWMRGGPWEGRKCIGNSLAVDQRGEVVVEGPFGVEAEAMPVAELALRPPAA